MSADSNDIGLGPYSGLPSKKRPPCSVPGCDAPSYCKQLCKAHYNRNWRHGSTDFIAHKDRRYTRHENVIRLAEPCSVADCDAPAYCRGVCRRHYARLWRYGDPFTVIAPHERRSTRLSKSKVIEIRKFREAGVELKPLAKQHDCSTSTISAAALAKNWKWAGKRG